MSIDLFLKSKEFSKLLSKGKDQTHLSPEDIKIIIQKMIKEHLGWLVVWGGFFGGFLGLTLSPIGFNIF